MDIFKLFGSIAVDNTKANEDIDETTGKAEKSSSKFLDGVVSVGKWATAITTGAIAAGTAIVGFSQKAASTADNVDKMSQKIGISRQAYQELDFICSQSGTSVDTLQMGIKTLTSAMDGAASGTKNNVEQFERLGIAVTNADGSLRSQEDVMWDTMSALQGMENQTEKSRLATELFGRSGTELMPLLNGTAGSIEEMKQQAHDLGLVLNDEIIDNGVNLTDSLDQTKRAFESIGTKLAGSFMPLIEKASDYIQQSIPTIQGMVEKMTPTITNLFENLVPPLFDMASQILPVLLDLVKELIPVVTSIASTTLPLLAQAIMMLLPAIVQIVSSVLPSLLKLIQPMLPLLQPILKLMQPFIDMFVELTPSIVGVIEALEPLILLLVQILNDVLPALTVCIEAFCFVLADLTQKQVKNVTSGVGKIVKFVSDSVQQTKDLINNGLQIIKGIAKGFSAFLKGDWKGMFEAIRQTTDGVFGILKGYFNSFKSIIELLFGDISCFVKNAWSSMFDFAKKNTENALNGIKFLVQSGMNAVKTYLIDPIQNAFETVKGIVDKIKALFNFEFSLPNIKLPHFKITPDGWDVGDLLKGTIPKLGIDWYAKGGILTEPTAFGVNGSNLMVGGEAGAEAIAPIDTLKGYVAEAVASQNAELVEILEKILKAIMNVDADMLPNMVEALSSMKFTVDQREFARLVKVVN